MKTQAADDLSADIRLSIAESAFLLIVATIGLLEIGAASWLGTGVIRGLVGT